MDSGDINSWTMASQETGHTEHRPQRCRVLIWRQIIRPTGSSASQAPSTWICYGDPGPKLAVEDDGVITCGYDTNTCVCFGLNSVHVALNTSILPQYFDSHRQWLTIPPFYLNTSILTDSGPQYLPSTSILRFSPTVAHNTFLLPQYFDSHRQWPTIPRAFLATIQ
ncbi:hypothetical protein RRG08_004009 [Elysia crispata]|uniref:Uncharacterized protein n=1 Tax=Elysia crispata TaxID=231223 RepID=A0AAE0Y5V2_9GAST|nr:hypothetical protein RRG08_004009 [Elysia crispata]